MRFAEPLIEVTFLRRYKRFLCDVRLADGTEMTVHCANSGSMKSCQPEGGRAWISDSKNPKRKLRYSLEAVEVDGARAMVNTARPNHFVEEAIADGTIAELAGYDRIRREVRYGSERSRIDLLLERGSAEAPDARCYVEVKNVTLGVGGGAALFPDAVTARGTKHLRELMGVVEAGDRAALVFCAGRTDTRWVGPADDIDPLYGETLRAAAAAGVEILAYRLELDPEQARLVARVPVRLDGLSGSASP